MKQSGGARKGAGPKPKGVKVIPMKQLNCRGPSHLIEKIQALDAPNTEVIWLPLYDKYGPNFERLKDFWQ